MKSVDYWCNEAVRLANPPPDANWASMKNPMAWLIEQIQKDAAQVQAARDEEIARLKEALKTAQSWLEIWALHVGECRGGIRCECGLTNARYEATAALNDEKPPTP